MENEEARAEPIPPAEQPLMRTYLVGLDMTDVKVQVKVEVETNRKMKTVRKFPSLHISNKFSPPCQLQAIAFLPSKFIQSVVISRKEVEKITAPQVPLVVVLRQHEANSKVV